MAVAHLYRALQQSGDLLIDWADMDVYLSFHNKNVFKAKLSSKPSDWLKQFGLAKGVPVSVLNRNSRAIIKDLDGMFGTYKKSRPSPRALNLDDNQPLLTVMRNRYSIKRGTKGVGMVLREAVQAISSSKSSKGTQILEEWDALGQLSPVHTLETILYGIQSDEMHLRFDFMNFNRRCIQLLRRLRNTLLEKFPHILISEAALQNENLDLVVAYVFGVAEAGVNGYLAVAAEVMKSMIEKEGNKEKMKMPNMPLDPTD